jgi:peptidoglycan/LPS O-acetylase OafA/YrhL
VGYLAHTRRLAAATPASRNRVVDFWRVLAILMVVCGHWLAVSIWVQPDGTQRFLNSLEWVPHAGWLTWVFQVMPVFFLAGGYANARGLGKVGAGLESPWDWVTRRARRLFTPVVPLLLLWVVLTLALGPFLSHDAVHTGAVIATMPIWFLAVYMSLTALAPLTHAWWRRWGSWSLLALAGAAIAVDLLRFVADVPGIGWANFVFVWAFVHQIGYWWSERDNRDGVPARAGWLLAVGALGVLIALTRVGWYPVAMVTIPGSGESNMTPPTVAIALLGMAQFGVMIGTRPAVGRLVARPGVWRATVAFAGLAMTVFLWHLTAAMLTAAAGLSAFGGAGFRAEPGTTLWWATRPLWFLVVGVLTLALVALFGFFELSVSPAPGPAPWAVVLGVVSAAGSSAATALVYINTTEARIGPAQWAITAAALAGAALLRAFPTRRRPHGEPAPG